MGWPLIICGVLSAWAGMRRLDSNGEDRLGNVLFIGGLLLALLGCSMMDGTVDPMWHLMM